MKSDLIYRRKKPRQPTKRRTPVKPAIILDDDDDWMIGSLPPKETEAK